MLALRRRLGPNDLIAARSCVFARAACAPPFAARPPTTKEQEALAKQREADEKVFKQAEAAALEAARRR